MRKATLISLSTYCHKAKTWDMQDILIETVQHEDRINHVGAEIINIPKIVSPVSRVTLREGVGLYGFFRSILP